MKIKLISLIMAATAGLALLGATSSLQAATITVTSTADSGAGSLRAAIASAVSGDTINFAVTGNITLTTGELLVDKNLTILGPGPSTLAVDGNNTSRVFRIGPSTRVSISGLTITHGNVYNDYDYGYGGGIYSDRATLSVSNSILSGNSAFSFGGAIYNNEGRLTFLNSTLSSNSVAIFGGGIYNDKGVLILLNSTLSGNSAGCGGGSYNLGSAYVQIANSTLSNNYAGGEGGAIANGGAWDMGSPYVQIANSTLSSNYAGNYGGAIDSGWESDLQIANSTLSSNYAGYYGGAICNEMSSDVQIANSTISDNSVRSPWGMGGAIYNSYSSVQILRSTLSGNTAPHNYGGAIWNDSVGGSLRIGSSILNAGAVGENIAGGSVTSLGYNLSSDAAGGWLTAPRDQVNTDPMLGPLQDNGGPTFTHALLGCSPAIDRGKNLGGSATDQRGLPRRFDDPALANAAGGDGTDVGAFEAQAHVTDTTPPAITCPANVVVNRTPGLPTGVATFAPVVRDNCDPSPTVTCTPPSGSAFPYGTTIVTCQAVDASGNSSQCSFTVTVSNQPPIATATAKPAFEPLTFPEYSYCSVVSANNTNATVTLDGSASSDPDSDPLAFAWSKDGVTFSTDATTTTVLSVGWNYITLTVTDLPFLEANSTNVWVVVITPSQAVEAVIWAVDAAGIRRQDSQPLVVSLKSASEAFDRGSIGAGVNKLQAFQEKVAELVAPTNPTAAAELIALAQQVIDAINAQPAP